MIFALLLACAAVGGGALATYLYDRDAPFLARLCAGVCVGFAALGLVGFIIASFIGLNAAALVLAGALAALPLLLLLRTDARRRLSADIYETGRLARQALLHPGRGATGVLLFYCGAAIIFWLVFDRAMYQTAEGIFTGVDNNIGDLPFHLAIISGFVHGENFPPQHPEFAGARLTYPFMVDFVTAMFVRAGATLQGALFWQNFALALSLTGLLHRWAQTLTRDRVAALLTPALVLLGGGFGFTEFLREAAASGQGIVGMLKELPHDYTIGAFMGPFGYRWGNAITTLLIPQRGLLFGIPLALVVWTLWWKATEGEGENAQRDIAEEPVKAKGARAPRKKGGAKAPRGARGREEFAAVASPVVVPASSSLASLSPDSPARQMLAAGVVAGLLPLAHAYSFVVMMLMGACLALVFADWGGARIDGSRSRAFSWPRLWASLRPWLLFALAASVLAAPQMWWATRESGARASQFFGWSFGWDHGQHNVVWFWIKNTALFIPLLVAALLWRGRGAVVSSRLLRFYAPFLLCFIVPNVYRLSPWVWDNIKILFYWWIASAPLVALLLTRLWRRGAAWRFAALALLFIQVFAGSLDVWRVASGAVERQSFDRDGVAFAELVKRETPPRSLILHAPTYNDPVYLTGRRAFVGYDGHLWSHGIDYGERMAEAKRIYAGAADAASLIERRGIEYVVIGPMERAEMLKSRAQVNENFFQRYIKVGEAGERLLYKTRP